MNKLIFLLIVLTFGAHSWRAAGQQTLAEQQEAGMFLHTVERGQTVYSISLMYGVNEADIYRLNPSSREVIKVGQSLKIPQKESSGNASVQATEENYVYHTIQTGETLYGVSRQYAVSGEDLAKANQGLTPQTFAAGKTIRIPATKIQSLPTTQIKEVVKELKYTIKRRETMYSLSRRFNVSSEELIKYNPQLKKGLKAGMELVIPVKAEAVVTETSEETESGVNSLIDPRKERKQMDAARIALLLPFFKPDGRTPLDVRVIEFYEGFLLSVDSMRNTGMSVELYVYDIGEDVSKTAAVLENNELQQAHLLIGGMTNEQIEQIAAFARKHEKKYVVPFSSKCEKITLDNPYVFQVNASPQNLYSYVTPRVRSLFSRHRIILLNTEATDSGSLFSNVLKADLNENQIPFAEVSYNDKTFSANITNVMSTTTPNLIIPVSSSLDALLKIKGTLRSIVETKPEYSITLFGHPEWQSYTKECLEDFYMLNAYFYASSYMNRLTFEAKHFSEKYKDMYHKPLPISAPKYAALGYDMGMYFLTAIRTCGYDFEGYLQQIRYNSIQSGFNFGRVNNWGGFFNTNFYIVHYNKKDYSITRGE